MIRGCRSPHYIYLQMHSQIIKLYLLVYRNKDKVLCIDENG